MKKALASLLRNVTSPSLRYELKHLTVHLRELARRAKVWQWEFVDLPRRPDAGHAILYLGRKAARHDAMELLGIERETRSGRAAGGLAHRTAFVSELPIPGALRVPQYLSMIVALGRPLDEITAAYDSELRRLIRKQRGNYSARRVLDDADIERLDRDMLKAFAAARHGENALQVDSGEVRNMARAEWGRLDVVYAGEEPVACHLGSEFTRAGKRYWRTFYFGYPQAVFSDKKRLREANAMNTYLALEWAKTNGFDYYDIGLSIGRPDGGLLQWKRRRKAVLEPAGVYGYFHIQLPRDGVAQFLWDMPLFSVKRGKLVLHLGIPDGPSDEEIAGRYREMGFSGLSKVYLHCERAIGDGILERFHALYSGQEAPPAVVTLPARG